MKKVNTDHAGMVTIHSNYMAWFHLIALITLSAAPTAAPVNPSAYAADSMTIVFSWSPLPPEQRNGIIRHYIITVTEVDTNYTFIAVAAGTEITLHSLHPYFAYRLTVAAMTIASGPPSSPIVVQTLEDG